MPSTYRRAQFDAYSQSLQGTNTAFEQMATNNDNFAGAIAKLKSEWDAFLLTLGQSGLIQGIADNIMLVMEALGEVVDVISDVISAFEAFGDTGIEQNTILRVQLDLLVKVIKGVGTALEIIVRIAAKVFNSLKDAVKGAADWIGEKWANLKKSLGDIAFARAIVKAFNWVMEKCAQMINKIKQWWHDFLSWLGMESGSVTQIQAPTAGDIKVDSGDDGKVADPTNKGGGGGGSTGNGGGSTTGGKGKGGQSGKASTAAKEIPDVGSLADYEARLKALNDELNNKNVSEARLIEIKKEKAEIEETINKIKIRNGLLEDKTPIKGSIKELEEQVRQLNDELNNTEVSTERLDEILDEKEALEEQIKTLKIRNGLMKPEESKASIGGVERDKYFTTGSIEDQRQSLANAKSQASQIGEDLANGLITPETAQKMIDDLNEQLKAIGLKPLDLTVNVDSLALESTEDILQRQLQTIEEYKEKMEGLGGVVNTIGGAFNSLGNAIGGTGGMVLDMAGQTAQAVAQIIPQVVSLIAAKEAEALASGTASGAGLPFPANIAAIASIIATITALFAGFAGMFADGGVVGGTSFQGDKLWARVNSGEMILNKAQQASLYSQLGGAGQATPSGKVEFEISGTKLKGVLRNYDNKIKRQS